MANCKTGRCGVCRNCRDAQRVVAHLDGHNVYSIARDIVSCYVGEHGAVPASDQLKLRNDVMLAIAADVLANPKRHVKDITNEVIEAVVMGDLEEGGVSDKVKRAWPNLVECLERWSV